MCGKVSDAETGGDIVFGRPESFKDMIGECQECGISICGGCATRKIIIYASPQYKAKAFSFVSEELEKGREIGDLMDEVYQQFNGAEMMVTYHCPKCNGIVGPP